MRVTDLAKEGSPRRRAIQNEMYRFPEKPDRKIDFLI